MLPAVHSLFAEFLSNDAPPPGLSRNTSRDFEIESMCGLPLVRDEHLHFIPTMFNMRALDSLGAQRHYEGAPEMPATCETVAFETAATAMLRHAVCCTGIEECSVVAEADLKYEDAEQEQFESAEAPMCAHDHAPAHSEHVESTDWPTRTHDHAAWTSLGDSDQGIKDYLFTHCCIAARDLKPNALSRMRDLGMLFRRLQDKGVLDLRRDGPIHSVFGFSHFTVHEIADFNAEVTRMVHEDGNHCWKANGRADLRQPTSTVYELLRQLGVHPVKGTRGNASEGMPSGTRDFMFYREYAFDLERLKRNCPRLRIGAIGNRRTYK